MYGLDPIKPKAQKAHRQGNFQFLEICESLFNTVYQEHHVIVYNIFKRQSFAASSFLAGIST